jgi:mRNA-degrading endonuclease toxin of MazEF toxin-antitoxin module
MYELVKVKFPFADDFAQGKPRPSLVISPSFGKHQQTILAYITTQTEEILETGIVLEPKAAYFPATGLRKRSIIKLHRVITVVPQQIEVSIGVLPDEIILQVKENLLKVFQLP